MDFSLGSQIFDIAYSSIGLAPTNSAEHYRLAASCGFPALKGDIRPTSDGGLVMCHDSGFTFDADGRITKFDKKENRPILDMTYEECIAKEYTAFHDTLGYYAHVTPYEDFVRVCAETGRFCFTTIRDKNIPQACAEMFRIVRKYGMEDRLMVNSFTYEALKETRKYSSTVPVSFVQGYHDALTDPIVDAAADLGNAVISMFSFLGDWDGFDVIGESMPVIERALGRNIPLFQAIVTRAEDRERALACGFTGFQLARLMAPYALPKTEA